MPTSVVEIEAWTSPDGDCLFLRLETVWADPAVQPVQWEASTTYHPNKPLANANVDSEGNLFLQPDDSRRGAFCIASGVSGNPFRLTGDNFDANIFGFFITTDPKARTLRPQLVSPFIPADPGQIGGPGIYGSLWIPPSTAPLAIPTSGSQIVNFDGAGGGTVLSVFDGNSGRFVTGVFADYAPGFPFWAFFTLEGLLGTQVRGVLRNTLPPTEELEPTNPAAFAGGVRIARAMQITYDCVKVADNLYFIEAERRVSTELDGSHIATWWSYLTVVNALTGAAVSRTLLTNIVRAIGITFDGSYLWISGTQLNSGNRTEDTGLDGFQGLWKFDIYGTYLETTVAPSFSFTKDKFIGGIAFEPKDSSFWFTINGSGMSGVMLKNIDPLTLVENFSYMLDATLFPPGDIIAPTITVDGSAPPKPSIPPHPDIPAVYGPAPSDGRWFLIEGEKKTETNIWPHGIASLPTDSAP
jgi:hypothetical protein